MGTIATTISRTDVSARPERRELSLLRLYMLRAAYFIMAAGLSVFVWPSVLRHTNGFAVAHGAETALLAGLGAVAALGIRYPVKMLPVLLFEVAWKAIYLVAFAYPAWSAHQVTPAMAEEIRAVSMVVILLPLIPWRFIFRQYVLNRGERWS
ncbi:MAG: hypothetical protein JSS69_02940 [Acidobacteria bacterium]|nr:hypothetical protein [Acidobacteriota bacterium]MBS1864849.1 hypothetical protein [Acidobacteriota bacterium]